MNTVYLVEFRVEGGAWRTHSVHATKRGASAEMRRARKETLGFALVASVYWMVSTWKVQK